MSIWKGFETEEIRTKCGEMQITDTIIGLLFDISILVKITLIEWHMFSLTLAHDRSTQGHIYCYKKNSEL